MTFLGNVRDEILTIFSILHHRSRIKKKTHINRIRHVLSHRSLILKFGNIFGYVQNKVSEV